MTGILTSRPNFWTKALCNRLAFQGVLNPMRNTPDSHIGYSSQQKINNGITKSKVINIKPMLHSLHSPRMTASWPLRRICHVLQPAPWSDPPRFEQGPKLMRANEVLGIHFFRGEPQKLKSQQLTCSHVQWDISLGDILTCYNKTGYLSLGYLL